MPATPSALPIRKRIVIFLAVLYALGAGFASWSVIGHSQASAKAIEQVLTSHVLQNEASRFLEGFGEEHPFLEMFFSSPLKEALKLPTPEAATKALGSDVSRLLATVRKEAAAAAWWSWLLVNGSLLYVIAVMALERSHATRFVLFSLTGVSLAFFAIGILAPAMIIWTAPSLSIGTGKLEFVLQHEVRGIAMIIRELFTSGHWVIAGFLLLFSILTPLTKAALTFFVTLSSSHARNARIVAFLHAIGKWSMADVFVAGVLLSLYALKAQEATKSIPCLGLYYFLGYCLLSMTTTELVVHSEAVGKTVARKLGGKAVAVLFAGFLCVALASGYYTSKAYPLDGKGGGSGLSQKLRDANLGPLKK